MGVASSRSWRRRAKFTRCTPPQSHAPRSNGHVAIRIRIFFVKARGAWLFAVAVTIFGCATVSGCVGSSRIEHGQRYQSDDSRFDSYFEVVHQQQVAAEAWPDE